MTMSTMSTEELYRKQDLLCMPNGMYIIKVDAIDGFDDKNGVCKVE
jgi:hypothetical protein